MKRKDGSKYTVIELNCAPCLLQACVALGGRAQIHTHTLTNGRALLFVYLTTAGTQANPSDFTCRPTYVIVMPTECLLAPDGRFLIACLLSVLYMPVHICAR